MCQDDYFWDLWPSNAAGQSMLSQSSTVFIEFVSLWIAVRLYARRFSGSIMRAYCDNAGVVQNWQSQCSPSSGPIQAVIKAISLELLANSVYLVVEWIPTLSNVLPDYLSRQGTVARNAALDMGLATRHRSHVPKEWLQQAWGMLQLPS